jgi:hypothetical protein
MKKILLLFAIIIQAGFFSSAGAQVLNVNNTEQEYNQWCWAACSKAILDYYGFITPQCDIAEYTRSSATWHSFGTVNCCTNAQQGCNYWNYNWGYAGSIQDILIHFGNLQNIGGGVISQALVTNEMQHNRLFVIRWEWSSGGGHFIVGHGINGNNVYFMNPWFGEGLHIGTYSFMLSGVDGTSTATHTWTHTNRITSIVDAVNEFGNEESILVYPNPFSSEATIQCDKFKGGTLNVYNVFGQQVMQFKNLSDQAITLHRDNLPGGIYFLRLTKDDREIASQKLIVED